MKILVTGGAGFIGSHVVQALLARGDEIVVVDDMNSYYSPELKRDRIAQFKDKIVFYQVSVGDYKALETVFAAHSFDVICHLAAQAGVRYSLENPFAYNKANVDGMLNILELMRKYNLTKLVYASSSSVYGANAKVPFAVEDPVDTPISLYAATKRANELYAYVYHHLYGFDCFGLRFFTVYGPWGRPDMALFKFTDAIMDDKPIDVYNQGKMKRSFTYITDVVRAVILSLEKVKGYELLNVGSSTTVELNDFIACIERALGKKATKKMLPLQQGDVPITYAEIAHTTNILGWEPLVSVEEGVTQFITWYKNYKKKNTVIS